MKSDRLLNEVDRQKKYLARLPKNFNFPLFNSKQALESQRRNGYRNTAAAAREIVDNSLEAGAKMIHVIFDRPKRLEAFERQDSVSAVAFIDDGSGMLPAMARYALSWGGGTHFDEPDFIGRFGFGLPNSSINQTRLVEVYTRTNEKEPFTKAWLDANTVEPHGVQTIPEPVEAELPEFVERYLDDNDIVLEHGTVVVWVKPDRLTYRMASSLKEHLVDDFGVVYRYLLDEIDLKVDGIKVEAVDPLFLDPRGRFYLAEDQGGAKLILDRAVPVKYIYDPETGAYHVRKIQDKEEVDPKDENLRALGSLHVKIARFPVGFAVHKRQKKTETTDANRRFEVRKGRRGMSFVRSNREIETVDAFPKTSRDINSGLGNWPMLQSYAYHWGVEVKFEPSLDEVFGITNDKQTVRPVEDFWRVLADDGIDAILMRENAWQVEQREKEKAATRVSPSDGPSPAEKAAAGADAAGGRKPRIPPGRKDDAAAGQQNEAEKRVGVTAESIEEALDALEKEAKVRPYRVDYEDVSGGPFYRPEWVGTQIVIWINRKHSFYETLYAELLNLPGGARAKESIDVLLIALGKAELTVDDEYKVWYEVQREQKWSSFLAIALKVLAQTMRTVEEPDDQAA